MTPPPPLLLLAWAPEYVPALGGMRGSFCPLFPLRACLWEDPDTTPLKDSWICTCPIYYKNTGSFDIAGDVWSDKNLLYGLMLWRENLGIQNGSGNFEIPLRHRRLIPQPRDPVKYKGFCLFSRFFFMLDHIYDLPLFTTIEGLDIRFVIEGLITLFVGRWRWGCNGWAWRPLASLWCRSSKEARRCPHDHR